MSDAFPPPPPEPPAPPPPGNLTPPPGYAAYEPSPMGVMPLRRVSGTAKALTILLALYAVVSVLVTALSGSARDSAQDFLRGELTDDEFTEDLAAFFSVGLLQVGLTLAIVVLTMIWMYRVASNHRALERRTTWAPGFAIGGWFLPPFLFIIPLLILLEMWKASDPTIPPRDDTWRQRSASPVVFAWWVFYGLAPVALFFTGASPISSIGADLEDQAEQLDEEQTALILQSLSAILAAVFFILLVRGLTARPRAPHRRGDGALTVFFVRHAQAGERATWPGDDVDRPLTDARPAPVGRHRRPAGRREGGAPRVEPLRPLRADARAPR